MSVLIFDPASLQNAINAAVPPQLPDGHASALVGTVDQNGVQAVVEVKKQAGSGTLELQGVYEYQWTGDQAVGARVIYSW